MARKGGRSGAGAGLVSWLDMDAESRMENAPPPPPAGLECASFAWASQEIIVLTYPLPELNLPAPLSKAERDVAIMLLRGCSYRDIAAQRRSSTRTVANQLQSVFRKVGVSSR